MYFFRTTFYAMPSYLKIILLLSIFSPICSYSQCHDADFAKTWGKWNELRYNSAIFRLEHRTHDSTLPANIRNMVHNELIERCGKKFYSHIKINDLYIVIPLQKKQHDDDLTAEGINKKGEIKYYYNLTFFESPNVEYRFNIALDVLGNILTEWRIPKVKDDGYSQFVSLCESTVIASKYKEASVKKINDVILFYDPKLNQLGWKITMSYKMHESHEHYKAYRTTVDVFTGKILDRWEVDVIKYDNPSHK
jgi:hypothetical protein